MRFKTFQRVVRSGFLNFWRNAWVTIATVFIFVVTILTIGSVLFAKTILTTSLEKIESKVDITVYFKTDALPDYIASFQDIVRSLPQVTDVEYITREQALKDFKARHSNNALITQSLDELGENPLGASLNIRAASIDQYEGIAVFLNDAANIGEPSSPVDKINYFQNKLVIERLSRIIGVANRVGLITSVSLAILAILVAFNTIRLAIYTAREEISVMRLVGANNWFVSTPFAIEGVLYGAVAAAISAIIFYPVLSWLGPLTENFFGGFNIFAYYTSHFARILLFYLVIGVLLGAVSSAIAIRRYLRV